MLRVIGPQQISAVSQLTKMVRFMILLDMWFKEKKTKHRKNVPQARVLSGIIGDAYAQSNFHPKSMICWTGTDQPIFDKNTGSAMA